MLFFIRSTFLARNSINILRTRRRRLAGFILSSVDRDHWDSSARLLSTRYSVGDVVDEWAALDVGYLVLRAIEAHAFVEHLRLDGFF